MKPLKGIQRNFLYQVCVFRADPKKQYDRPGLWLAEIYFDFSSETAERNSAKLDTWNFDKILTSSTKFVFFGPKSE